MKDKLKQFCDIRDEIDEITKKIRELESKANAYTVVQTSMKDEPYSKVNIKVYNPSLKARDRIEQHIVQLKKRYDKLLEIQLEVETFINTIENSRIRRIFEYRYFKNYTWRKVANCVGGYSTADSVRKEHDRFLQKN